MLKRDPILISLSPTSLRVGVLAGAQIARSERIALEGKVDDPWARELRPLDDVLRAALQAVLAKPGTPALMLYHAPRSVAEVFSVPAVGSAADQAVELYLQQNLPNAGAGWLTEYLLIQENEADTNSGLAGDTGPASASAPALPVAAVRTTALTYADNCEDTDTIAALLRRAGLEVAGIMPAKAAMLRSALQNPPTHDAATPNVYIHLGEHAMTLTAWSGSRLLLARCAEVGYSQLVDAVYRSAKTLIGTNSFSRETATRTLFACGMPRRGEMMDSEAGLSADAVLPLTQPAMQRYVVEVRQTLRFGMMESDVAKARVWLTGPGSAIPGLADALGEGLELNIERLDQGLNAPTGGGLGEEQIGDLTTAQWLKASSGWFVPPSVQVSRASRRVGAAVRGGGIAAALVLSGLAAKAYLGDKGLRTTVAGLQSTAADIDAKAAMRSSATRKTQDLESVRSIVTAAIGSRTDWRSVLAMISTSLPQGVELLDLSGDFSSGDVSGTPSMMLRGRAQADLALGVNPVSQLLETLTASPLVQSARVVSSRNEASGSTREFSIAVQLRSVQVAGGLEAPILPDPTTNPRRLRRSQATSTTSPDAPPPLLNDTPEATRRPSDAATPNAPQGAGS